MAAKKAKSKSAASKSAAKKSAAKKKSTLRLRLAPDIKAAARRLARGGRRSLNGLVEFLIRKEAERIEKKSRPRRKTKK